MRNFADEKELTRLIDFALRPNFEGKSFKLKKV